MSFIKWEDPPSQGRTSKWGKVVKEVAESPGKWALVAENISPSVAVYLKKNYNVETKTHTIQKNPTRVKLYMKVEKENE